MHVFSASLQIVLDLIWPHGTNLIRQQSIGSSTDHDLHGPGTSFDYCASTSCDIPCQCCVMLTPLSQLVIR